MNLFIGNLPINATELDLCQMLRLSKTGSNRRLRIFKKSARDGRMRRFGLLYLESGRDMQKLLERNRAAELHGQRLEVREFMARAVGNERRAVNWRQREWSNPERRLSERRASQ